MLITPRVKPWQRIDALLAYSDADARRIYRESWRRNAPGLFATLMIGMFVAMAVATLAMLLSWLASHLMYLWLQDTAEHVGQIVVLVPLVVGPLVGVLLFSAFRRQCVAEIVEGELTPERADISRCTSCAREVSTVWRSILDDLGIKRIDKDATANHLGGDIVRAHRTGSAPIRALMEAGDADAEES